jgi:hypothetical protein
LQERADVGRKDAIEDEGDLVAEGCVVRKKADDGRSYDERREEGDHGGVGGGLSKVEAVVLHGAEESAVEDRGKAQKSSHGISSETRGVRTKPSTE